MAFNTYEYIQAVYIESETEYTNTGYGYMDGLTDTKIELTVLCGKISSKH